MTFNIRDLRNIPLNEEANQQMITYIDTVDANTMYVGNAAPGSSTSGSVWRIKKIATSGAIQSVLFAGGTTYFDKKWSDRATYTYS